MILGGFGKRKTKPNKATMCRGGKSCANHPHPLGMGMAPRMSLKKQSQFVTEQNDVIYYMKGDYDNIPAHGVEENKPNQTQFLYRQPGSSFIIVPMLDARYSVLAGYRETRIKKRETRI